MNRRAEVALVTCANAWMTSEAHLTLLKAPREVPWSGSSRHCALYPERRAPALHGRIPDDPAEREISAPRPLTVRACLEIVAADERRRTSWPKSSPFPPPHV